MNNINSTIAWHKFKDDGRLTKARKKVYFWLCVNGAATARKLDEELGDSAHKRLSELERMGYVKVVKNVVCPTTGHQVAYWDVDKDAEPVDLPRPAKSDTAKRIQELEAEVAVLQARLREYESRGGAGQLTFL